MAISDPDKANFKTLQLAWENGAVALVESRDKVTGEYRALICAMGRDGDEILPTPLAVLVWGNPFEQFVDPTMKDLPAPTDGGLMASIRHALNFVPNSPLIGSPGGYATTYDLAAAIDKALS